MANASGIPPGYEAVDPRTARRVPLWQELGPDNPLFPGDPPFSYDVFTTIAESGYLLERITSLGTHTGTHISAPAHVVEGAPTLGRLDESWTLMPLAVIDVRARITRGGGDFLVDVPALHGFEQRHGWFPQAGCVLLLTGFSARFDAARFDAARHDAGRHDAARSSSGRSSSGRSTESGEQSPADAGIAGDYFDPAPGFSPEAVAWLFETRGIIALGADSFGPDATSDTDLAATATALRHGGITVENVGPGLARMRPRGDWISINGARPAFSGFQVGITGFTLP